MSVSARFSLAVIAFVLISGHFTDSASAARLSQAKSFTFLLQADKWAPNPQAAASRLASLNRDIIVIDYSFDGSDARKWTPAQIKQMKMSPSGKTRPVIAYISIGEAENYRHYWKSHWDPDNDGKPARSAPNFLLTLNPNWSGNYKVKFWNSQWQSIVRNNLKTIQSQGFDGIYLDIVDAFEFFEFAPDTGKWHDHKVNPETGNTYRTDMIHWVQSIARFTRSTHPDFLIIPQNALQLLESPHYRNIISAVGSEDLWTNGSSIQPIDARKFKSSLLTHAQNHHIPILLIEYCQDSPMQAVAIKMSRQLGASLLFTDRALKTSGKAVIFD